MVDLTRTFLAVPLWLWMIGIAAIILIAIVVARKMEFEGVNFTVTPPFLTFRFKRRQAETRRVLQNPSGLNDVSPASSVVNVTGGTMNAGRDVVGHDVTNIGELHQHIYPAAQPPPLPRRDALPTLNVTEYIDRGIEDAVRTRLLQDGVSAIVGIHAPGGVGKTELAKYVARQVGGAYDMVKLVDWGKKTPDQIVGDIALACGIILSPNADYRGRVAELHERLQAVKVLLIYDDVRDKNRIALDELLPPAPCSAIVTSRIGTLTQKIRANALFQLENMDDAQARRLLNAALDAARVAAEEDAANAIIARVKGNPLMLDIAARCVLQLTGHQQPLALYAQKLAQRLDALNAGDESHLNWEAVMDLSYDDLNAADQKRFRALAVFSANGFTIPAAQFMWNDQPADAAHAVAHLREMSLIKILDAPGERYRLHDLLDEYADKQLAASGEETQANDRHAQYLVKLFGDHYTDDPSTAPEIVPELENLRVAVHWARATRHGERLAQLATTPRNWLVVLNLYAEWYDWLDDALRVGKDYDQELKANVLQAMGDVQQFRKEMDTALASYAQALELFRAVGDRLGEANVRKAMGDVQQFRKEMNTALESYAQALELFRAVGSKLGEANVLQAMGDVQQFRDERDTALESYAQALELFRAVGDRLGEANVRKAMGDVQQFRDERDTALESYAQALELFRAVGSKLGEANVLQAMGDVQQFRDERDTALESYAQALELFRAVGDRLGEANVRKAMGDVQQFRDERDTALESYAQALELFRAVGSKLGEANVLQAMGDVQQFRKEMDTALASYAQALELFRAVGSKLGEANVLQAMGDVQQFRDERDTALESYAQALELFRAVGDRLGEANVRKAMGDVQQFRDERDTALESYAQALELFRAVGSKLGEANVLQAMGDVQQFRKEMDTALASYAQALELFRAVGDRLGEANVLAAWGQMFLVDDSAHADELLNQAIAIYQAIGSHYSVPAQIGNCGFALLRLGELDRAHPYFVRATELFVQIGMVDQANQTRQYVVALQDAQARLKFASELYDAKDFARASREYRRVTELAPQDAGGWLGLGNTLESLKRREEAIAAFSRAIELEPNSAYLYRNRANQLLNLDRLDEAARDIARAVELEPEHVFTHARQGELALMRGQFADALTHLQFAAEHDESVGWQIELAIAQLANDDVESANKTLDAALAKADADDRENARDWLERVVKLKPDLAAEAERWILMLKTMP